MQEEVAQEVGFWSVGSLPPDLNPEKDVASPDDVQAFLDKYLKPGKFDVVSGGEVRPEQQVWIVGYSNKLGAAAGIRGLAKYSTKVWHYIVRLSLGVVQADRHMTGDKVPAIGTAEWAIEDRKAFDDKHYDGATFTVNLASAIAYRMFSGAMFTDTQLLEDKIVDELRAIYEAFGKEKYFDTVFQLEVPFEMFIDAMLPHSQEKRTERYTTWLASIKRIIQRAPKGTRFAFHLCWGDLGGEPAVLPFRQRVGTKIAMINAIIDLGVWDDYVLYAIHDPFGDGKHAPRRLTKAEFRQYDKVLKRLPQGTRYAIGILSHHFAEEQLPGMIEDVKKLMRILGFKGVEVVYLSTHCGLGRKTPRQAVKIFQQYHYVKSQLDLAA